MSNIIEGGCFCGSVRYILNLINIHPQIVIAQYVEELQVPHLFLG